MQTKDLLSLILSIAAFFLSIYATVTTERKSSKERKRTIRGQLTDVLGKLAVLQLEAVKLQHEAKTDRDYLNSVSSILGQQNGFLLDQAVYLSDQIPSLVTTYEFNTIAVANAGAGNLLLADKYFKNSVNVAPNALYKSMAIRGYAMFLYPQGRLDEGRDQFRKALEVLKGEDNLVHFTNGLTYQCWAVSESHFARSPERANEYFENARKEFALIDTAGARETALADLEAIRASPQAKPPPGPTASFHSL